MDQWVDQEADKMKVKIFSAVNVTALSVVEKNINDWLAANPHYEIVHQGVTSHSVADGTSLQIAIAVWYEVSSLE